MAEERVEQGGASPRSQPARAEPVRLDALGEGRAARAIGMLPGADRLSPLARVGVALGVLALLFLAALATDPWGFIVFGAAVGLLVVAGVPAAQVGVMSLAALGRAALPLLLPLFVFVAAGVVKSPRELQFAVGLITLLAGWFWLVKPDWDQRREVLRRYPRSRSAMRAARQVGLPALLALAAVLYLGKSIFDVFGGSDYVATRLFVVAVLCLAVAAVLRLLGYARTAFRAAVALALVLLLARLAIELGVLPGGILEEVEPGMLALIAGALLALTAAVEIVTSLLARGAAEQTGVPADQLSRGMRAAAFLETPVTARWLTDRAAALGTALSLFSAFSLLVAVFAASSAGGAEEGLGSTARAGQPTASLPTDDHALAAMFSPVLTFTADQRWTPIAVDDYVRGATVTDWEGRATRVDTVDDLETDCLGVVGTPCYVMRQRCADDEDEALCAERLSRDRKAVYVRVARKADWKGCERSKPCVDGSPNPFANARGTHARATEILVQYWYFYPFDEWVAPVAIGDLKQVHPADWEAVTVGLSRREPLWVAYSAHCGGTFADWERVPVAESDPKRLRPLVAVAYGSQANYRLARESRVPNFAECSGIPKDRLTLVSYAANIRDRTDDSRLWDPGPGDLRLVTAETPPMSFPGRWSAYNRMTLETLRRELPLGRQTGGGPSAPPLQRLWQKPMSTIFGGGAWKEG